MTGFGFDKKNHRHLSAAQAGLRTQDMRNLELAWAIGVPEGDHDALAARDRRQDAVPAGGRLRRGCSRSTSHGPPCVQWVYENEVPLRTSAGVRRAAGLEAQGAGVRRPRRERPHGRCDDGQAASGCSRSACIRCRSRPARRCCTRIACTCRSRSTRSRSAATTITSAARRHGAVTALDARTGKTIWTAHTMEDAKPVRDRGDGKMLWGPSGAPIWTSPAIDEKRGVLYVGTGEATSEPAAPTTDAILAIDLKDGSHSLDVPGDRERHLPERLRAQSQRPQLPEGHRVPRRRLRRVGHHRAALRRQGHPARGPESPARSGRSIRTTAASWSGARTSAKARRSAAFTGASRTTASACSRRSIVRTASRRRRTAARRSRACTR